MHSTFSTVAALSTTNKIGLSVVGALFIIFALVSSFVLPRRNPNFPGRAVGWYSALAVLFLIAMISAVLVFGVESEEETAGSGGEARTETVAGSLPGQTTESPGTTTAPGTVTTGEDNGGGNSGSGSSQGDAAAGKSVFASAGCGGCHTLKAGGGSGNVGPNLDELKPDFDTVQHQVENGGGGMPPYKGDLSEKQIADVAAFVAQSAGS